MDNFQTTNPVDEYGNSSDNTMDFSTTDNMDNFQTTNSVDPYGNSSSYSSDDSSTWTMENFQTTNGLDNEGNSTSDSVCDPSPSCWFYNCCSSESAPAKTAEEIAAEQKASTSAVAAANSAAAARNNAVDNVNNANALRSRCGTDAAACAAADAAIAKANAEYAAAQANFDSKIAIANAAYANVNPGSSDTGAGFLLCGNGMLGRVCDSGGGVPITVGLGGGGLGGNFGSSGFGNVSGLSGATPSKCGVNFQDIGGVCFPTNTGLANPQGGIAQILSNLFSWLMGLFTTFAVIAFVVSGIQYFMSTGNEDLAETAKDNAKAALVGIIVGLSGFIIIKAIAAALSGQSYFF
jgi:hypothetical protein